MLCKFVLNGVVACAHISLNTGGTDFLPDPLQMFEHSQALLAHQQQHQSSQPSATASSETPTQPVEDSSFQPSTSQQHGSVSVVEPQSQSATTSGGAGIITQSLLATALAGAMGSTQSSTQPSPMSSLDFSTVLTSR